MKAKIISLLLAVLMCTQPIIGMTEDLAVDLTVTVEADLENIDAESLLTAPLITVGSTKYLADSLRLPSVGKNGSVLTWESSDENVLNSNGSLKRPVEEVDEITLTATAINQDGEEAKKDFVFNVAPLNLKMEGILDFGALEVYRGSDFSDDDWLDSNVFIAGLVPDVADGIATPVNAEQRFYWNNGGESLVAYVEFVMRREANEAVVIKPMASNSTGLKLTELIWNVDNSLIYYTQSSHTTVSLSGDAEKEMKVGIYIDDISHTFSLWINNALVADRVDMTTKNGSGLQSVNFKTSTVGNVSFESYGFYTIRKSDESIVKKDFDLLTLESLLTSPLKDGIYLTSSLNLLSSGANGAQIVWESSDESTITTDGTIVFPFDSDRVVTLEATVSCGDVTKTKSFCFTVPCISNEYAVAQTLENLNMDGLLTAPLVDGKYLIDSLKLPLSGFGDASITWLSSNEKYIDVNGDVKRPSGKDEKVTLTAMVSKGDCSGSVSFEFEVASLVNEVAGLVPLASVVHSDSFSSDTLKSPFKDISRINGNFKICDGKATINYSEGSGLTDINFYLSNDFGASPGEYYIEFILSRTEAMAVNSRTFGSGDICITGVDWFADGSIGYYEGSSYKIISASDSRLNKLKIGMYFNSDTDKYSLYLDNKLVLDNINARNVYDDFRYMRFYMQGTNYTTLEFESYCFYSVYKEMPDNERVELDKDALAYENLISGEEFAPGIVNSNLILPVSGKHGSVIEWKSSDESIISNDGILHRPDDDKFHTVVMTASIVSGTEKLEKTFEIVVPGKNAVITDDVGVKELICFNDFETDSTQNLLQRDIHNVVDKFGISDGKYRYTSTDGTGGPTYLRMYPTASGSQYESYQGVLGFEITLAREKNELVKAIIYGSKGIYLNIEWLDTGAISLGQRNNKDDAEVKWLLINHVYENEVDVKCLMDTRRGIYSLWLNGENVVSEHYARSPEVSDYYYTEIQWTSYQAANFTLDDHKVYYAVPPTFSRLESDFLYVTQRSILTKEPVIYNCIDADLNLYKELPFGSTVEWTSSRPDVIDPDTGVIQRKSDPDNDVAVTLTAKVSYAGSSKEVSFDFVVLREFDTVAETEQADYEMLTLELLTDESADGITKYLNLMNKGLYGSDIVWTSSDEKYILPSGRVVRPRWDSGDENVVITATIAGKFKKDFDLIVKADEKAEDPMKMTDEEFFGVWDGDNWSTNPKLDYDYDGMGEVGQAVKAGDYKLAKEKLFEHMKNRPSSSQTRLAARDTLWVTGLANGLSTLQSSVYCHGEGVVESTDYEKITVSIDNPSISTAMVRNYDIISKYNDTTGITIAGSDYHIESMRPVMVLYVNGSPRYYKAESSATVRTGQYMNEPYDSGDELKVKMFGDFLGDETYRAMILFDFSDITETDKVTTAELIFYAKKTTSYSEPKEFYVLRNPNTTWNKETVSWSNLTTYVHNFNGVVGGNNWKNVSGSDVEYAFQCCRFRGYRSMMTEYLYTGDESYSYAMVKNVMDFINDCEYGHPRTLDTACRLEEWASIFDYLVDIKYVDADICTAILKTFYNDIQVVSNSTSPTANWIQTERRNAYNSSALFPEFSTSEDVKNNVVEFYNNSILNDFYPDGAYIEDTAGYNELALDDNYIDVRSFIAESGGTIPEEFDATIHKAAYYNMFLRGPAGESLGYGDNGGAGGPDKSQRYSLLSQWYNDYELQFVGSYGAKGVEPSYTSVHLPDSTYTFMRSQWSDDALYLFTNVRGGGAHGHFDDNSLIVMGYGQHLLSDAGYVTYSTGVDRNLAVSTKMHNTVSINDENQNHVTDLSAKYGNQGDVHEWTTNSEYDVLSQTTKGYTHIDNNHRRTITFVKSGFWIVSDLMTPNDKSKVYNYKQNWHMLPLSNAYVDEKGVISTAYLTGGNIKLVSPDNDARLVQSEGVTTSAYGQPEAAPWMYYEKNDSGNVSFDTVLLAYEGNKASLKADRIELGVSTDEASAMKFSASTSQGAFSAYYLLDYENGNGRIFDKYMSNGFVTVVTEDKYGNITQLILNDGSYIKTSSGKTIVDFGDKVTDASVEIDGTILKIVTSDESVDLSKIKIKSTKGIKSVVVNGKYMDYNSDDSFITLSDKEKGEDIVNDKNANLGIVDKNNNSGSQSGGGSGGNGGGGGFVPNVPEIAYPFTDIGNHWAKSYIFDAHEKGYVNGYSDNTYRPDNNISRAEFVTMLCRAFKLEQMSYNGIFSDVGEGEWFAGYVSAALANGIISADTHFRPQDTITREEMCKMLAVAMKNSGWEEIAPGYSLYFTDINEVSDWAVDYVSYVCYHNIMNGRENGSFSPKASSTRAEAATVFSRLFQYK